MTAPASSPAPLILQLFGPFQARLRGTPLPHLRSRKGHWLLALLTLRSPAEVEREWLAGLLWPESSESDALASLRKSLTDLRQALGSEAHRLHSPSARTLSLELAGAAVDVVAFDEALARGDRSSLEKAVSLYRGPLLEGCAEEWVFQERRIREQAYLRSLEQLAQTARADGDAAAVERYLRLAVGVDPTRETAQRALMQALAECGNFAAAVGIYRELRGHLYRELNAETDAETKALFDRIRAEARQKAVGSRQSAVGSREAESSVQDAGPSADPPSQLPAVGCRLPTGGEAAGGAVPLDSPFYIERPVDHEFCAALARHDSIILINGMRQMGKTSLLGRGLQRARRAGDRVVLTDFQLLSAAHLASADAFYLALGAALADQLELDVFPDEMWERRLGPMMNFSRYLRREVLSRLSVERSALSVEAKAPFFPPQRSTLNVQRSTHLVWAMDQVDRLLNCEFGTELFSMLRSWHNQRVTDPEGPWSRLTMVIAYATEAHLFVADANQSPFNVGTRVTLEDFSREQVEELNRRHGAPLRDAAEVARFHALLGGHPYLIRLGLHEMATRGVALSTIEAQSGHDEGLFGDHLRRILALLSGQPELEEALRTVLDGRPALSAASFYRLRSAGILSGASTRDARPRCRLYADYLRRHLPRT